MREKTVHRLAFEQYVRLGGRRSLIALHELLRQDPSLIDRERGPALSTLEVWSAQFHWNDRAHDLEREAVVRDREKLLDELRAMNERHAREGLALQQMGVDRLSSLKPDQIPPADAVRAVSEGVRIERLAKGAPTERQHVEGEFVHGHIDLSKFGMEELRRLAEIAERGASGDLKPESG